MKKVLLLTVVTLFLMATAAFAKTAITDSDLNDIAAQEGVSIYLDNITVSPFSMVVSWGQSNISSITGQPIANFQFDQGGFVGGDLSIGKQSVNGLLTIDVGVNNAALGTSSKGYTQGKAYGTYIPGGVAIGLDNIALAIEGEQLIIKYGSEETLTSTATVTLGTWFTTGLNTTINGQVIISTH
ncbi:MAG: hypothetical protein ACLQBQ_08145 [Smithella sp.]